MRFVAIEFLAILTNQLFYASILVEKKWQYFALRRVINLKRKTVVSLQLNSILQRAYSVFDEYSRRRLPSVVRFTYTLLKEAGQQPTGRSLLEPENSDFGVVR